MKGKLWEPFWSVRRTARDGAGQSRVKENEVGKVNLAIVSSVCILPCVHRSRNCHPQFGSVRGGNPSLHPHGAEQAKLLG